MVNLHHDEKINDVALIDETVLVDKLRSGDETAFLTLVEAYQPPMIRLALRYVADMETAEEVVQETWVGVLRGIHRFEGRSCLKTWIFCILANRAKSRGKRESRCLCFSDCSHDGQTPYDAFFQTNPVPQANKLFGLLNRWMIRPDDWILRQEIYTLIEVQIAKLPDSQRCVILLRDIEGWSSEEVCGWLNISAENQRVLLSRARSKVRQGLISYQP